MKYRRFFILIAELVAVCSAVLFIPVLTVREVYTTQSASFHANLIGGLFLKPVTFGDISFFCHADQNSAALLLLLACTGTIFLSFKKSFLSFKKSLWVGILFYAVVLILLTDGSNFEVSVIVSPALHKQGHTGYQGPSPFILFDLLLFTAIPVLRFLLFKHEARFETSTAKNTDLEQKI